MISYLSGLAIGVGFGASLMRWPGPWAAHLAAALFGAAALSLAVRALRRRA